MVNTSGESAKDVGGWDMYGQDWRHYFDCMLAPVAKQAAGAVLCCAVLCCAVLCCAVLCCAVLCWTFNIAAVSVVPLADYA